MDSPSVQVQTIDKTTYIPNLTNEIGAFVGHFERGPIDTPIFITNIDEFKFLFGRGVDDHHNDWYQVYNYLQYASGIYVIRTCGTKKGNANNGDELYINTYADWLDKKATVSTNNIRFIARTAGAWGNLLSIAVITKNVWDSNPYINGALKAHEVFEFFEERHLGIAIFRDGLLVEKFYKSYFDVETINDDSLYVYVKVNDELANYEELSKLSDFQTQDGVLNLGGLVATDAKENLLYTNVPPISDIDLGNSLITFDEYIDANYTYYGNSIIKFSNGYNAEPVDSNFINSYELLENAEKYDIDIIIGNDRVNHLAVALAEKRRDCIAFIGIPTTFINYLTLLMGPGNPNEMAYTQNGVKIALSSFKMPSKLTETAVHELNKYISTIPNSQFVHFTMNIKVQRDAFTNTNKLVNVAGDTAGLKSKASLLSPWIASAGLEKGKIKNSVKMYINLNDAQIKEYYKKGLNFIQNNVLMSQKTYYTRPSSFDRVNVRSLFNHVEKETKLILNRFVFEENTLRIRQNIGSLVKRYLEDVRLNKGISEGQVHVYPSESNPNEIIVEVYIKPTYAAEFIVLRMSNVGTNEILSVL